MCRRRIFKERLILIELQNPAIKIIESVNAVASDPSAIDVSVAQVTLTDLHSVLQDLSLDMYKQVWNIVSSTYGI